MVSNKTLALHLCRNSTKMESSKQVKYLLGREKKYSTCRQTHGQTQNCLVMPMWQFELLVWGISSGFPLANHFNLPVSPYLVYFRILLCVCACAHVFLSQARRQTITQHHSSFELQGTFLHICSRRGLLTLRMKNTCSLIFYPGRAQYPLSIVLLLIFWRLSPQGMKLQLFHSGGFIHLLPELQIPRCITATVLPLFT